MASRAQFGLARIKLFEAVELWQKASLGGRATEALLEAAEQHKEASRWQYALECYRRVLDIRPLQQRVSVTSLNSTAWLYFRLQQFDLAIRDYQRALETARQIDDRPSQALALTGLAAVYAETNQAARAGAYLDQARLIEGVGGDRRAEAATLHLVGRIYRAQGRAIEAREAFHEAIALYKRTADEEGEALVLCDLGNLHLAAGQKRAAFECATEAVRLASYLKGDETRWRAWLALARAQRALSQVPDAIKSYYRAFSLIEKQGFRVSADPLKIGYLEERQAPYRELADLLIGAGRSDEAFLVLEHARCRSTLNLLASSRHGGEGSAMPEQSRALQDASQKIARLKTQLRSAQLDEVRQQALEAELQEAELRQQEARLEIQMSRLKLFTRPINLKQVQATVLRPDEMLIEFFLSYERSYAWLITAEDAVWVTLPAQEEIERSVGQYLESISHRPSSMYLARDLSRQKNQAAQLFSLLLGKLKQRLARGKRLIVVADGLLNYLPFETLVSDRYLIEDHVISYMPSASVFGLLRQAKAVDSSAGQMELLAFGDPALGRALPARPDQKAGTGINDSELAKWLSGDARLPPLPNTREEVLSISQLFPPDRCRVYLGEAMTEEAIKREQLRRYKRLHFATHSLIDERLPSRSAVLFALDDDPAEDGLLGLDEIAELDVDCDIVILSACQTGRGRLMMGEGVLNLARAFLFSGARSAVVSLWNVSDLSGTHFMKQFYQHLAAGTSGVEALRQVKLELIASRKAMSHPFYWASFILIGNSN
jgi:CHAT domain-containing protein